MVSFAPAFFSCRWDAAPFMPPLSILLLLLPFVGGYSIGWPPDPCNAPNSALVARRAKSALDGYTQPLPVQQ